jgi:hypothetical protein
MVRNLVNLPATMRGVPLVEAGGSGKQKVDASLVLCTILLSRCAARFGPS